MVLHPVLSILMMAKHMIINVKMPSFLAVSIIQNEH
ncbi:hypothetical protein BLA29_007022 [Euroglyphus maynei]|uniref:Uncharacterized protein n=1 Tax=Euroglyphus maynei TaxID=6958 RepID=A0A1Y3BQL2_EURMA|nr:hypothetical protein BLA29_007022 [Euroglyphus maynei]